ncbi:ankyrin repeat domain-containing protein [Williamsia sp. CHRR-6]|uniref:ankyrin repeat domain-containing protein n=1 Tax=Williamsia sp. CHRR-6 TaxID=2835871 RepID=UPI001BDB0DD6|nr:ankyrin repeat domain-containing protein [Williamsia sp. CHRR-6]MBT0568567.1 ankyrin repeat domain-containing protein [Williamsia sp. CHRR-6]
MVDQRLLDAFPDPTDLHLRCRLLAVLDSLYCRSSDRRDRRHRLIDRWRPRHALFTGSDEYGNHVGIVFAHDITVVCGRRATAAEPPDAFRPLDTTGLSAQFVELLADPDCMSPAHPHLTVLLWSADGFGGWRSATGSADDEPGPGLPWTLVDTTSAIRALSERHQVVIDPGTVADLLRQCIITPEFVMSCNPGADVAAVLSEAETAGHPVRSAAPTTRFLTDDPPPPPGRRTVNHATGIALIDAVCHDDSERVRAELRGGTDPEVCAGSGWTALMWTAHLDHPDQAEMLLNAGAQVDRRDGFGNTALISAMLGSSPNMVALLLEAGADPLSSNNSGVSPVVLAERMRRSDYRHLIDEALRRR